MKAIYSNIRVSIDKATKETFSLPSLLSWKLSPTDYNRGRQGLTFLFLFYSVQSGKNK
jgi:hypothetical protein